MNDEEIFTKVMEEYVPKTSHYVSCIRIDGKPILPPLISDEYRKELLHYRKLALLVEKKLKDKKLLCDNRQSVDSGIITNATSEPSWLNNSALPAENITTSFSSGNECAINCESNVVSQSDVSEIASSKTLICDDDMWRYLSKCSSDSYITSQIDITEYDISSDVSQKFENPYDVLYNPLMKPISKLTSGCALEQTRESVKHEVDVHEVEGCENILRECNADYMCENNIEANQSESAYLFESCRDEIFSLHSESSLKEICASQNHTCRKFANDKAICNDVKNSGHVAFEESVTCVCDGSLEVEQRQFSKRSIDFESDINQDESISYKTTSELTSSGIEECNFITNASKSLRKFENLQNSCDLPNLTPVNRKTNCPKNSLKSPVCSTESDKKVEKYDPLKYSSEGKHLDVSYSCIGPDHNSLCNSGNDNRSSGEIDGLESDSTFTDSCAINIPEQFLNLDYSSVSQKIDKEIPLSESISISETDYQACSVATVSQDTPEEASELCNELSLNKNYDFDTPKLVRQNSYTLIAPSPVLLAHAKASEKLENGGLSEDDNSVSQKCKVGRKSWDTGKNKTDCNLGKTGKYIYAVPLKQTTDFNKGVMSPPNEAKPTKCKVLSLPGSSVASPVKMNPYFSSVDNLPMVNVRKFHEFISSKVNTYQLPSESNAMREHNVTDQKFPNYPSFLDVPCEKNVNLSEADLINCNLDNSQRLANNCTELSTPTKEPEISNQVNNSGFNNLEETYKSSTFSASATSYSLGNSETNVDVICEDSNKRIQASSFDGLKTKPNYNSVTKHELGHLPVQDSSTSPCDSTVQSVFLQLQNHHSLLMAQLLDRQKKEQETLANTFLTQQRQILREMKLIPTDSLEFEHSISNLGDGSQSVNNNKNSLQNLSDTQSVEFASSYSQTCMREHQNEEGISLSRNEVKDRFHDKIEDSKYATCNYEKKDLIKSSTLPQKKIRNYSEEHKKAATIINAYVRGYLVRRLLKTEHVQEIIKTISESVMCALQLQRECPVDITPSDIELHRRLIQQLTAACHCLHETFFSLTLQEKMNIIANDREKRSSQLQRPTSAKSAITAATQKYLQRKQQLRSSRQSDRPVSSTRRSWWRSKGRVSSAGNYEQSSSCFSKQPSGISSKQQQCNNRSTRRPWR